jgi:hypothetical protein
LCWELLDDIILKRFKQKYFQKHTYIIGFSCTISQEKIPITKYSNFQKAQKLKRTKEDTTNTME